MLQIPSAIKLKFLRHQISDDGSDGLQTNEFYGISISNSDDLIIEGGVQDCASFIYDEATNEWYHTYQGDGIEGAVSLNDKNKVIVGLGCCGSPNSYYNILLSDVANPSSYKTFTPMHMNLGTRLKPDPSNPDLMYIGGYELYKVSDCFSITSAEQPQLISTPVSSSISAFCIAKNNSLIKYVAETIQGYHVSNSNHMWRYDPSNSSWVDISTNLTQYGTSFVTDIVTNPKDDYEVWVCMGQTTNGTDKVFHSTDGGIHWISLSQGYPYGIPANRILYDYVSNCLYLATDVGLFKWDLSYSESEWVYITESIPLKMITDIERDYVNHRLILSTFGRGIWEWLLPEDECYDETPFYINNEVNWENPQLICSDIIIENGGNLSISSSVIMSKDAIITIEYGGTLTINGGIYIMEILRLSAVQHLLSKIMVLSNSQIVT